MSIRAILFSLLFISQISFNNFQNKAKASDSVNLYTPYTKISVPPGESINYSIDVFNNGNRIVDVPVYVSGLPGSWNYDLSSGGWNITELSVLPGEKKTFSLQVDVPLKVNKGNYWFKVNARGYSNLSLMINVTEKGTYKTEFTSDQANMQGPSNSTFSFRTTIENRTGEKQRYSLRSGAPRGWNVIFKPNFKQATSVEIEPNNNVDITVDVDPPRNVEAGTYKIPLRAITKNTSAELELEAVVTGTYEMELTTPTGLLSAGISAGDEKKVELLLRNTGSVDLTDIELSSSAPRDWEVTFDNKKIELLEAGKNLNINAVIKTSDKAIPGDYVTKISAKTPEADSQASFRIAVKTPALWGWVGILIILTAAGSIYYLFRKYGRR